MAKRQPFSKYQTEKWAVPEFLETEFRKKSSKNCVIVFVLNEGTKFKKQLQRMQALNSGLDVVVADGGSTDGSTEGQILNSVGVRTLLTKTGPGALSAQMRMAFSWALKEGYDGVIIVDGNGKDDISAIPQFEFLLSQGFDHIQGSRFIPGGRAINTPWSRLLGLKLLHAPLISMASRTHQTDTTNGFRAYSSRLISDPEVSIFRDIFNTYELHYHLAIESGRNPKFRTVETPVTRSYPKTGKTPTKISPIKGNSKVLVILFKAVAGRYRLGQK